MRCCSMPAISIDLLIVGRSILSVSDIYMDI
jgi:hypothetical protein